MGRDSDTKIARKIQRGLVMPYTKALAAVRATVDMLVDEHGKTAGQAYGACREAAASGDWAFFGLSKEDGLSAQDVKASMDGLGEALKRAGGEV